MSILAQPDETPPTRQIRAVGTLPDAEVLFVGALLWALPDDAKYVVGVVQDDDLGNPVLRALVAVIRELLGGGRLYTPAAVLDRLERRDGPRLAVRKSLNDCLTSGAASCPEALRDYASAVVAGSLRRCIESGGAALRSAACQAAEGELTHLAAGVADTARSIAERLAHLRGEAR